MKGLFRVTVGAATTALALLAFAGTATATDFCVPDTSIPGCPAGAVVPLGSDAAAKIEGGTGGDPADGVPDTVHIGAGTYADPGSFTASGSDPLTVIGAGREKTFLTSSAASNTYVLNLFSGNTREITIRDLAVLIPASFPNNAGAGVIAQADRFESVDLISRNEKSTGVFNPDGGTSFEDFRAFGQSGGSFGAVFYQYNACGSGEFTIDRAEISDAGSGLIWACSEVPATVNRIHLSGVDDAIDVSSGGQASVTNALIESSEGPPIRLYNGSNKITSLALNHLTVVATGDPNQPAIRARVDGLASPTKNIEISLANSIVSGFQNTWSLEAPSDPVKGNINLSAAYSDLIGSGLTSGESFADQSTGNIDAAPGFAGATDFHLVPGSPAIDAGDPLPNLPALDLDGKLRPVDGNGDGNLVRDMGAYEFQPPPSCETDQSLCPPSCETDRSFCAPSCETDQSLCPSPPDTTAPEVTRVKFRFRRGRGGALRFRLSEQATVRIRFAPIPRKAPKGKQRKVLKITRKAKQGAVKIKLARRRLKPGRYRLTITATDQSGNRSKPLRRKVRAKRGS